MSEAPAGWGRREDEGGSPDELAMESWTTASPI